MELVSQKANETEDHIQPVAQHSKPSKKAPGAFLTISEVADELDLQQHVLRFWETKFSQVKPLKRGGGRRYYRPEDVKLLKIIHGLLYTDKYTIKGVQKLLKGQSKMQIIEGFVANNNASAASAPVASNDQNITSTSPKTSASLSGTQKELLKATIEDLKQLRSMISP